MKTRRKVSIVILCMAAGLSSCSKDDKNQIENNKKAYFPAQISTHLFESSGNNAVFNFSYNDDNEIIKITQQVGSRILTNAFTYTNHLLSEASFDNGTVVYSINYDASGRIASISEGETNFPFNYNQSTNKYYWQVSATTCYADFNENNAIEAMYTIYNNTTISTSEEKDGVFKNLQFQPALSLLLGAFSLTNFDLYLLSPSAITGYHTGGTVDSDDYTIENVRDDNGNITTATYINEDGTPREGLEITYEARETRP